MADAKYEFDPAQISDEEAEHLPAFDPGVESRHSAPKTAHVVVPRNDATAVSQSRAPVVQEMGEAERSQSRSMFARMSSAPARLIYRLGCILFACIDRFLAIVNMPFAKLTPATRNVIGVVGAGTMLLSAAAMFAKPYLFPEPDPVGDLRRQVRAHPHSDVPQHPSDAAH